MLFIAQIIDLLKLTCRWFVLSSSVCCNTIPLEGGVAWEGWKDIRDQRVPECPQQRLWVI